MFDTTLPWGPGGSLRRYHQPNAGICPVIGRLAVCIQERAAKPRSLCGVGGTSCSAFSLARMLRHPSADHLLRSIAMGFEQRSEQTAPRSVPPYRRPNELHTTGRILARLVHVSGLVIFSGLSSRAVSANLHLGYNTITNISAFQGITPRIHITKKPPQGGRRHACKSSATTNCHDLVRSEHLQTQNQRPLTPLLDRSGPTPTA